MRHGTRCATLIAGVLLLAATTLRAEDAAKPGTSDSTPAPSTPAENPYSGSLMERSTLTGDWGARSNLADKGMTFDLSITQIYQGVVSGGQHNGPILPRPGGGSKTWEYGGQGDFLFNLDSGKAGLWQGGFFTLEAEGVWGNDINNQTGAIVPASFQGLYLSPSEDEIALTNVSYTQFISPKLGFFLGKIATLTQTSGDMNAFAHGKGDSQFMNMAFNFNPVLAIVPYSTLAAGAVILPGEKPDDVVINLAVLDPNGEPNTAGFNTLGEDGTIFSGEARVRTNFFGRTGHQDISAVYSDKLYTSLDQNFRVIVDNRSLNSTSGAWAFTYNFDQYLVEPAPGKGWGVFGRFGVSDGDPNPTQFFWSLGLGGKGMIEARPNDGFGVGLYQTIISNANNVPAFLGFSDGWGAEAFYNIAITPWAQFSPDIQYIDGGRPNSDPSVALGFRLKLIF